MLPNMRKIHTKEMTEKKLYQITGCISSDQSEDGVRFDLAAALFYSLLPKSLVKKLIFFSR